MPILGNESPKRSFGGGMTILLLTGENFNEGIFKYLYILINLLTHQVYGQDSLLQATEMQLIIKGDVYTEKFRSALSSRVGSSLSNNIFRNMFPAFGFAFSPLTSSSCRYSLFLDRLFHRSSRVTFHQFKHSRKRVLSRDFRPNSWG